MNIPGSEFTANGRHKDDPTNPQSHWNDWSIDRDGNKLEGRRLPKGDFASNGNTVWSLEDAKKDYARLEPNCNKCKFGNYTTYIVEQHQYSIIEGDKFVCEVKDIDIEDCNIAAKCKYYTIK